MFSNDSNLFSSIQITDYFSAATPDFIHASTSLILNFHSLPIFVGGHFSFFQSMLKTGVPG